MIHYTKIFDLEHGFFFKFRPLFGSIVLQNDPLPHDFHSAYAIARSPLTKQAIHF